VTDKDDPHEALQRNVDARREKIAAEMRQLVADAEHWNRTHPDEEPIIIDPDFGKDVDAALARARSGGTKR
jgi:hypothetical protein